MPGGLRLILIGFLFIPLNHSIAVMVDFQVTFVGGNKSSWKSSLYYKQKSNNQCVINKANVVI